MNKLVLNERARHHIKIFPMKDTIQDLPSTESQRIEWCRAKYDTLQHSDTAKRLAIYKHRLKGYLIAVWEMDGLYYLIQSLRNEFRTFNDTIYIMADKDDALHIAKFLQENIDTIMEDYKNQILDARDQLLRDVSNRGNNDSEA